VLVKTPQPGSRHSDFVGALRENDGKPNQPLREDHVRASSFPEVNSRQLRAVLAVAEYRSFIAAASFLKTSQPALTRTIKQIEGALGVSLFSRSTRQVSITEAGKEFAALAERLLSDLKIGIENMRELADQQRGQIIVSSIMSLRRRKLRRPDSP
jgi:DNA-binding transcriptional LysR family regulator